MAFILKKQKQRKVALLLCASNNSEVENNDHCSFSLLTNSNKVENSLKRKKKKQFVGRTTQYDSVFPFFFLFSEVVTGASEWCEEVECISLETRKCYA